MKTVDTLTPFDLTPHRKKIHKYTQGKVGKMNNNTQMVSKTKVDNE